MIKLEMKEFENICDTGIRCSSVLNVSDTIDTSLFVSANIAIANVPYRTVSLAIQRRAYIIQGNLSQSAISLHQLFTSCPHLTYERA